MDAAHQPEPAPADPCFITGRLIENHPRVAGALGASMWVLAILLLTLHATRAIALGGDMDFMLGECWLIGMGSVGQPMLSLYLRGTEPSVRTCERLSTAGYTAAGLVTALLACGQMRDDVLIAAFLLIIPLAIGINAGKAAQVLARRGRDTAAAVAEGQERGWVAAVQAIGNAQASRDAKRNELIDGAESTAELAYDLEAYAEALRVRRAGLGTVTPLHAINGANGSHSASKHA